MSKTGRGKTRKLKRERPRLMPSEIGRGGGETNAAGGELKKLRGENRKTAFGGEKWKISGP